MTKILSLVVAKLKREPVAVWGVVIAAILGLLPVMGVPAHVVESIGVVLTLAGIPVVRPRVTPWAAVKAVVAGSVPAVYTEADAAAHVASAAPKDSGHSEVDTVLLVLAVVGVFLLLFGVTLR